MRRLYLAKKDNLKNVKIWRSGKQYREFMYVDDMAEGTVFLLENYKKSDFINLGVGEDVKIAELAHLIKEVVGYEGDLVFDLSKPDGMYRKLRDVSRLNELGWKHKTSLKEGLSKTYEWFLEKIW